MEESAEFANDLVICNAGFELSQDDGILWLHSGSLADLKGYTDPRLLHNASPESARL
jgi:hypothetical protein